MRPKYQRDGDMDIRAPDQRYNPYRIFSREQWAALRDDTPMTLEPGEFSQLRSLHDRLDIKEVEEIYLPLSQLLSIYVDAARRRSEEHTSELQSPCNLVCRLLL